MRSHFKKLLFVGISLLMPAMSSCTMDLSNFITQERDYSTLYVGGFPTVSYVDSTDKNDYYLYVSFKNSDETFDSAVDFESDTFNPSYDFFLDLNNASALTNLGIGSGLSFYNLSDYFTKYCSSYKDMKTYFSGGNYIDVFSSVGELQLDDNRCISKRARIGSSGEAIAFNTIGTNGSDLTFSTSYVYKESFNF